MLSNHKKRRNLLFSIAMVSVLSFNTVSFAGTYTKMLTGWEASKYELPDNADSESTGVDVIDDETNAYEGRGAIHLWSGGTKGGGYISCAAAEVDEFEEGKTYRLTGMIKTSQVSWGRPALTLGDTNIATSLASGLTANEWCEFSKDFTFTGTSKELRIQMWNTGDVYLDNVSLKEVTGDGTGEELLENVGLEKDYIKVYTVPIVIKDDDENIIVGASAEMEYSVDEGSLWKMYDPENAPDFSGDIDVLIRYAEDPAKESNVMRLSFTENIIASGDFSLSVFQIIKNDFNIEGTLKDAENKSVNVMLVREGKSKRSLEDIILVSSFETNSDGSFSFTAPVADKRGALENDGWYTLYLKSDDTEIYDFNKVYFASKDSRDDAIKLLKQGNTSQYFEEGNEYYDVFDSIGFPLSDYAKQGVDKTRAVSIFEKAITELGDSLNETNAVSEFSKAVLLSATGGKNETTMYELLKKYGADFSFKYSEDVTLDTVLKDGKAISWVSNYLASKSAETPTEVETLFKRAYALYLVNNATYGEMRGVIKEQESYLSLSGTYYDKYMSFGEDSSKTITISKYIVAESAKKSFADASELLAAIEAGVKSLDGGSSGGSSGGGSGSSSKSQISSSGSSSIVKPTIKNTDYFDDLDEYSWAKDSINRLFEKGIINGRGTRVFAPQDTVTRQEFVKMIVNLTGSYDDRAECEFEDVDKNAWYYRYVASAVKSGLILGISEKEFGTDSLITREQIAVIASRVLKKTSEAVQNTYSDDGEIGEYAKKAVYNVREFGIIGGYEDNTFKPKNFATRAESAVICLNLLNKR